MNKKLIAWIFLLGFFIFLIVGVLKGNFIFILAGVISLVALFASSTKLNNKIEDNTEMQIKKALEQNDFISDKSTISYDRNKVLLISESYEKIALLTRQHITDDFSYKDFDFKDVIEARVIKNNNVVTSTSLGSQVSRAAIGGFLLGGFGALAGGVTAKTNSVDKIKELTLEIVVDDLINPRYTFTFYRSDVGLEPNKDKLIEIVDRIEDWYRSFTVLIERNKKLRSV